MRRGGVKAIAQDPSLIPASPLAKPRGFRVIDVARDRPVLDLLHSLIDDKQRHQKPLAWHHRIAEPVLDLDVEAGGLEDAVDQVLELRAVDVEELVGRDDRDIREKEGRLGFTARKVINPAFSASAMPAAAESRWKVGVSATECSMRGEIHGFPVAKCNGLARQPALRALPAGTLAGAVLRPCLHQSYGGAARTTLVLTALRP
jgi:hypothetical protein